MADAAQPISATASGVGALAAVTNMVSNAKESFNKSGGQEVLASVTNSIPQGTKDYITQAKSKFFNREHLRPVSVFFGIGEENAFYIEKTPSLVISRINHNVAFFYMNYILLTTVLFLLTLVISPSAIIGIGFLGIAWMSVIRATSEGSVQVYGVTISQKQVSIAMTVVSGFVLIKVLSHVFWWTLGSSGCIVATHAFLRDASMHKDEGDKIEMTGDVAFTDGGEDASFLNPQSDVV
uniref:PRA1 family protein n=1 Tax=Chaetoceros debilis TaxID=122233 RepID=A0A7S3V4K1_9STRA|mmetsp:Transcript_4523/g.6600  ORF Transcript_4523/g.6600 Transcript_4523/m.6600 type:complete len:237 (+) Transcript_4523:83-793(+)|eukprot:CAMPEP_0194083628 /NCGR_PEP_ID=MMETSP0149-20130528/9671_1 /TAXON_ID=122233 /ORGANISM="Chaetoceros debilis, Strain MM31A-1" /LENGTH=236 /DNA_ID=CAMNT_0038766065 /DNA_START=55 /DNA_END=765 /DNA_ORIENTATION=-